jgi:hypothetical protein
MDTWSRDALNPKERSDRQVTLKNTKPISIDSCLKFSYVGALSEASPIQKKNYS